MGRDILKKKLNLIDKIIRNNMNIITLRSAYKVKEYHIQPCKQPNGLNLPFVKKVRYDSEGNSEMILTDAERNDPKSAYFIPEDEDIVVTDGTTFDLDDPIQKKRWLAIKDSDLIVPTRDYRDKNGNLMIDGDKRRYGRAEIWVDQPGVESEKSVSKKKLITRAWTFIENDSVEGRLTKCKLLGRNFINAPSADVEDYLYQMAEKSPKNIIDLYTNGDTMLKLLFIEAREKGVILKKNGLFMYGETILGATDEAVNIFFKNPSNKTIYEMIRDETYPDYVNKYKNMQVLKDLEEDASSDTEDSNEGKTSKTNKSKK